MRLGIVAALKDEARLLTRSQLELRQEVPLGDNGILQVSGMGRERARAAGERLISRGATALLSWGTAAALDPALASGTLILPQEIRSSEGRSYPVDPDWQQSVYHSLSSTMEILQGPVCESPVVLDSVASKSTLYAQTGCPAVDMESAALAQLALENGIPFLSLRFIVDPADMVLPASLMTSLDRDGQVQVMRLIGKLILHPGEISALTKLGSAFGRAKKNMQSCVEKLGMNMGMPRSGRALSE